MVTQEDHPSEKSHTFVLVMLFVFSILIIAAALLLYRFTKDIPVSYNDNEEHFKYGSIGSETSSGLPYWVWKVLPEMFPEKLPDNKNGYASFGFLYEKDRDLPIGVSRRKSEGVDRVWLNCAICHTGTVRENPEATPIIYTGMPANNFRLYEFINFLREVSLENRFNPDAVMEKIDAMNGDLDWIDRFLYRYFIIDRVRSTLFSLRRQLSFMEKQHDWGPGRVDTFNPYKAIQFNFPMEKLPYEELIGPADYPAIFNQGPRQGMQLHWDGNNTSVEERNKSAALGAGVTPVTIDLKSLDRIVGWLWNLKAPGFPGKIDADKAEAGKQLYQYYCADCHGRQDGDQFNFDTKQFSRLGKIEPIGLIGTDRGRLNSYSELLSVNQNTLYSGYAWRFSQFRKTNGYANMPLDGVWIRSPYLHNGSVPTLRDLLNVAEERPKTFYRGYDVFDWEKVGYISNVPNENGKYFFKFDSTVEGNSNQGHEGEAYGTALNADQKDAIVEYMKTF